MTGSDPSHRRNRERISVGCSRSADASHVARRGDRVRIVFTNVGKIPHEVEISRLGATDVQLIGLPFELSGPAPRPEPAGGGKEAWK